MYRHQSKKLPWAITAATKSFKATQPRRVRLNVSHLLGNDAGVILTSARNLGDHRRGAGPTCKDSRDVPARGRHRAPRGLAMDFLVDVGGTVSRACMSRRLGCRTATGSTINHHCLAVRLPVRGESLSSKTVVQAAV